MTAHFKGSLLVFAGIAIGLAAFWRKGDTVPLDTWLESGKQEARTAQEFAATVALQQRRIGQLRWRGDSAITLLQGLQIAPTDTLVSEVRNLGLQAHQADKAALDTAQSALASAVARANHADSVIATGVKLETCHLICPSKKQLFELGVGSGAIAVKLIEALLTK